MGEGISFDVNSLYPSRMRYELIPYGNPVRFFGEDRPGGLYPLFVQNIVIDATVKEGHIPCMQFKDGMYSDRFGSTEYITDTDGPVARCVTSTELELIFEQYDVHEIEYREGWAFKGSTELFADFIDETMEGKSRATIEGNTGMRQIYKLRANSSYGKLGTSTKFASMKPVKRDGRIWYEKLPEETRDGVYIPAAAFITAYARSYTIRAAQANFDRFVYSDTDSIYLRGTDAPAGIEVDDVKLGAWKLEHRFQHFKALRAKRYVFIEDGKLNVRCAGMPERCIDFEDNPEFVAEEVPEGVLTRVTFENFETDAVYWGKLYPMHADGGQYLRTGAYRLRM